VIGVDLSYSLLKVTRARSASLEARVVNATALRLPFKDGSIGGVWSSGCLLHLKRAELPVAISEICRVLAPGAPVGISMKEGSGEEVRQDGRVFTLVEAEELYSLLNVNFVVSRVTGPVRKGWLYALAFQR
jgi:ubiquinone/menaquinone biosynthesis C-methylase UbiE